MSKDWRVRFNAPFTVGAELENIACAIRDGRLSGDGPYTKQCHQWLESHLGCGMALLTHSGTSALEMASILCGLGHGDEVIMPSFTFVSTANAFVLRGAKPVFIDIHPDTLGLDPELLEAAITENTKAIVPVHYGGIPCDMARINKIAEAHGLRVIEDAAHAMLATERGRCLGSIGHVGCLSFHETKNIISGEGGALLINEPELMDRARVVWNKGTNRYEFNQGKVDKYTWVDLGSSYLPSELTAAFLIAQFGHADQIIAHRLSICSRYREGLSDIADRAGFELPRRNLHGDENGHIFYLLTADLDQRSALITHLAEHSIMATFHYVPLHSSPAGNRFGTTVGDMSVTNSISDRLIRLPVHYRMTMEDVDWVISGVRGFYGF